MSAVLELRGWDLANHQPSAGRLFCSNPFVDVATGNVDRVARFVASVVRKQRFIRADQYQTQRFTFPHTFLSTCEYRHSEVSLFLVPGWTKLSFLSSDRCRVEKSSLYQPKLYGGQNLGAHGKVGSRIET